MWQTVRDVSRPRPLALAARMSVTIVELPSSQIGAHRGRRRAGSASSRVADVSGDVREGTRGEGEPRRGRDRARREANVRSHEGRKKTLTLPKDNSGAARRGGEERGDARAIAAR